MSNPLPAQTPPAPTTGPRPQPVTVAGLIAGLVTLLTGAVVSLLARRGLLLPDAAADWLSEALAAMLTAVVGAAATWLAALRARRKVTPLESPQTADGTPLVPATDTGGEHAPDGVDDVTVGQLVDRQAQQPDLPKPSELVDHPNTPWLDQPSGS